MSNTADCLYKASFPDEYADILMDVLAIGPLNFLSVRDTLYHFRYLDDDQAREVIEQMLETDASEEA